LLFIFVFVAAALGAVFLYLKIPQSSILSEVSNLHYSTFQTADFYNTAFDEAARLDAAKTTAVGLIVNHHLLAPHFIAQGISVVSPTKPRVIVLMSPDHFNLGKGSTLVSLEDWQTPFGVMRPAAIEISALAGEKLVRISESPFEKEHGVSNIIGFIKKAFPEAKILPLIVNEYATPETISRLASRLNGLFPNDSLTIASLDFYHGPSSAEAQKADVLSIEILKSLDAGDLDKVAVDSRPVLRLLFALMKQKNTTNFTLLQNSNAAELTGKTDLPEATSYITGYYR
jgi:AmmeMemoRadiSam system protein B